MRNFNLGASQQAWDKLVGHIRQVYPVDEKWHDAKPGSYRHNGLKFHRGSKTLVSLYARDGFFKVCIILGQKERALFEARQGEFSDAMRKIYDAEKTFHDGKWLWIDMYDDALLNDIIRLLEIKKPSSK